MQNNAATLKNSVLFALVLLLLSSNARAQRTLHIANTVTPPSPLFVYSQSVGGYLTTADPVSTTPISIASSSTTLFFAYSSFELPCKVTIDASSTNAAVVVSSVELSPTGTCMGAVVFNADGVDLNDIDMNRARVAMTSDKLVLQAFYGQSSYCHNCASIQIGRQLQPASAMQPCESYDIETPLRCSSFSPDSVFIDLPAAWPYLALPVSFNNGPAMSDMISLDIEHRGVYVAAFYNGSDHSAQALLINLIPADASYSPIFIMLLIIIISILTVNFVNRTLGWTQGELRTKSSSRLLSLDTFRGMCLMIMIFVNYGGGGYWFFDHSSWNGLTVADLVFPWFMWIMGVSMALGFNAASSKGSSSSSLLLTSLRRGATLLGLGLFLNSGGMRNVQHWRLPGVLQYFGFSYIVVSLIVIAVPILRNLPTHKKTQPLFSVNLHSDDEHTAAAQNGGDAWSDVLPHALQWIVALVLPIIYAALTWGVDVPGCPAGYLGPGGYADNGQFYNCTGGSHRHVDVVLFGVNHFYDGPTCREVYNCIFYDPEGFVGAFHAAFLVWLGLACGRVFVHHKDVSGRLRRLWVWGVVECLVAACLCGFSKDDGIVPVNKNLWSLSFILLQSGLGNLLLSLYYVAVDVKVWWAGNPLRAMGMNSILLYCGSEIFQDYFPFTIHGANTHAFRLFANAFGVFCWMIIAYVLYRKGIFIAI